MATPYQSDPDSPPMAHAGLTPDQLRRWAGLIAAGEDEFPQHLVDPDRQRLAAEVRVLRRERLLELIASAIARDIVRHNRQDMEVLP